ncbi:Hypothetical Protein FCC1311_101342 [Hondaea fermentalgiana]|uniref:Uncharacterized protein n=1 Tax=Hondaea fermentalgiana TaxID=2315210 RepID=A0A2R5GZK4_9STRA|nr:Hypothetical Protein FCC1311_101342 [Hondaea fermentalgiana]|eukprot:GBG33911.1 Hypothetical Protein FCC1311_101342 [Hondaea fermentalgiana]
MEERQAGTKCCGGCCYIDCIPDCCDRGCCGKCFDVCCCKTGESSNFQWNDPNKCCCGCCSKPQCCNFDNCRYKWCMCKCCSGNCICDPCALCCGEYKGNLAFAEAEYNTQVANKGSPEVAEMER